jgi:hypothetical protein
MVRNLNLKCYTSLAVLNHISVAANLSWELIGVMIELVSQELM